MGCVSSRYVFQECLLQECLLVSRFVCWGLCLFRDFLGTLQASPPPRTGGLDVADGAEVAASRTSDRGRGAAPPARLLRLLLAPPSTPCPPAGPPPPAELERQYAEHPWNINNMPRAANSVLRQARGVSCAAAKNVPRVAPRPAATFAAGLGSSWAGGWARGGGGACSSGALHVPRRDHTE